MNFERLQHLVTILQAVPTQQLDMGSWANECGTTACAVGWAARDPLFNQQGFTLGEAQPYTRPVPLYQDQYNWNAVCAFFGLDFEQADHLFNEEYYDFEAGRSVTPEDVIERIQGLIEVEEGA